METQEQCSTSLAPGEGDSLWILGQLMTFKVRGQTDGCSIFEFVSGPGAGAPPHLHRTQDETHYVLSGQYEFVLGGRTIQAGPGSVVHVPRGLVHGFTNVDTTPGTLLFVETPAGPLEEFMEAIGEPVADTASAPAGEPDMEKIVDAANRTNGIEFVATEQAVS